MKDHCRCARVAAPAIWVAALLLALGPSGAATLSNGTPAPPTGAPVDLDHWRELGRKAVPAEVVAARSKQRRDSHDDLILFGDLHVHTTYSLDAFLRALPMILGADGATPPVDACNYARYVAQLDFFAITDHAEEITPENWRKTLEALRLCANVSGSGVVPDIVPFAGFEWTQAGLTPAAHWGHHNVIFESLDPGELPAHVIRVPAIGGGELEAIHDSVIALEPPSARPFYAAFNQFARSLAGIAQCPKNTPPGREDCEDIAETPGELQAKLKTWGFPHMVIPHGSAWGLDAPSGSSWDHELSPSQYDPTQTRLVEIYSGHGNSEAYKPYEDFTTDVDGKKVCERPTTIYLPECWQAGEIIRERCLKGGNKASICENRAAEARQRFLEMPSISGWLVVPDSTPEEWLDAGQARGSFMPAFNLRPLRSIQYSLALTNFDDPKNPLRFQWGFVGSSDTHSARPGTGFKENDREHNVDLWVGFKSPELRMAFRSRPLPAGTPLDRALDPATINLGALGGGPDEMERLGSFLSLGGLVAVHVPTRSRTAIWDALQARDVYATSGVRILLSFDLINATASDGHNGSVVPMGGATRQTTAPKFRVVAEGSEKQKPGCPAFVQAALSAAQLSHLADNECFYPSGDRYAITRIEVVRIRPQIKPGEDVATLIEDPWKTFACRGGLRSCKVEFSDPDFKRDSVYYVRAIEEPTPVINGKNLRTKFDENGNAVAVTLCYMDSRTRPTDNCLASVEHRAWSSPIYVNLERRAPATTRP